MLALGIAPSAHADEKTCSGYSKSMGGDSFKEIQSDKERMAEKFGMPKCVDTSVCFVFHEKTKRVDVGVIVGNSCSKPFDVTVWLPKKVKGSSNDPDEESVSSTDPKKKNLVGSNTIAPAKSYTFGTITGYSREFSADAILFKIK